MDFLAEVAIEIDPRRASDVIAQIPPAQIAAITRELLARAEYVTIGRFVGHLGSEAISRAVAVMDDRSLLQVAFMLESTEGLESLVELLPQERVDAIVDTAAREDLWPEFLDLTAHLSRTHAARVGDAIAGRDEVALASLIAAAARAGDLWAQLLALVPLLPDLAVERLGRAVSALRLSREEVERLLAAGERLPLREAAERLAEAAGLVPARRAR